MAPLCDVAAEVEAVTQSTVEFALQVEGLLCDVSRLNVQMSIMEKNIQRARARLDNMKCCVLWPRDGGSLDCDKADNAEPESEGSRASMLLDLVQLGFHGAFEELSKTDGSLELSEEASDVRELEKFIDSMHEACQRRKEALRFIQCAVEANADFRFGDDNGTKPLHSEKTMKKGQDFNKETAQGGKHVIRRCHKTIEEDTVYSAFAGAGPSAKGPRKTFARGGPGLSAWSQAQYWLPFLGALLLCMLFFLALDIIHGNHTQHAFHES